MSFGTVLNNSFKKTNQFYMQTVTDYWLMESKHTQLEKKESTPK